MGSLRKKSIKVSTEKVQENLPEPSQNREQWIQRMHGHRLSIDEHIPEKHCGLLGLLSAYHPLSDTGTCSLDVKSD